MHLGGGFGLGLFSNAGTLEIGDTSRWIQCILHNEVAVHIWGVRAGMLWLGPERCPPKASSLEVGA